MNDEPNQSKSQPQGDEPLVSPEAPPSELPVLQLSTEFAVAEDVHSVVTGELIAGTSLWRDAWRRLLKNRLAVFGMIVVVAIASASLVGPAAIKWATGSAYDT